MANLSHMLSVYIKMAQQGLGVPADDESVTISNLIYYKLVDLGLGYDPTITVQKMDSNSYDVRIDLPHFYDSDGNWIKPSDVYAETLRHLTTTFSYDPEMSFNISVPFDQSKM